MPRNIYLYHNQKWCPAGYLNVTCLLKIKDNAKKKTEGLFGAEKMCILHSVQWRKKMKW